MIMSGIAKFLYLASCIQYPTVFGQLDTGTAVLTVSPKDSNPHSLRYRSYGGRTNTEQQNTAIINDVQKNKSTTFLPLFFASFNCHSSMLQSCSPCHNPVLH